MIKGLVLKEAPNTPCRSEMVTESVEREMSFQIPELVLSKVEYSTVAWERFRRQTNC